MKPIEQDIVAWNGDSPESFDEFYNLLKQLVTTRPRWYAADLFRKLLLRLTTSDCSFDLSTVLHLPELNILRQFPNTEPLRNMIVSAIRPAANVTRLNDEYFIYSLNNELYTLHHNNCRMMRNSLVWPQLENFSEFFCPCNREPANAITQVDLLNS